MGAAIAAATTNGSAVPIIDRTFALHDADKAHVHVIESVAGTRGKVVLDIAD
jgi:NADPH:quinone reductase-like Zn-dependent oxidoreductase